MNQLCKVCGEPAAGFHFGAFTCEGCKSFFGRTYNNLTTVQECKNNGQCVINKKNRTSCKACRLRKCLMVGMSKSGSRYGRRSNWFKIHCLLQEQTSLNSTLQSAVFNGIYQGGLPSLSPQDRIGGFSMASSNDGSKEESPKEPDYKDMQQGRVGTPDSRLSGSSTEGEDSATSGGSYRLDTPSPLGDNKGGYPFSNHQRLPLMPSPVVGHFKFPQFAPAYPSVFPLHPSFLYQAAPSTYGFGAFKPGLSPKSTPLEEDLHRKTAESYLHRGGSASTLTSPPIAGVAVEQDEPIDLSVRKDLSSVSKLITDSPTARREEGDKNLLDDVVKSEGQSLSKDTSPLDLTKRPTEIPQLG